MLIWSKKEDKRSSCVFCNITDEGHGVYHWCEHKHSLVADFTCETCRYYITASQLDTLLDYVCMLQDTLNHFTVKGGDLDAKWKQSQTIINAEGSSDQSDTN